MRRVFLKVGLVAAVVIVGVSMLVTPALAASNVEVGGVKVHYSKNGMTAYYNGTDDTLTIEITEGGGNLVVTATADAPGNWGSYIDTVIFGFGVDVNGINLKGRTDAYFFVAGEMNHCGHFFVKNGFVGGTDAYGDSGLYSDSGAIPDFIKIFNGVAIGPVFVYAPPTASAVRTKTLSFVPPAPGFNKAALIESAKRTAKPE